MKHLLLLFALLLLTIAASAQQWDKYVDKQSADFTRAEHAQVQQTENPFFGSSYLEIPNKTPNKKSYTPPPPFTVQCVWVTEPYLCNLVSRKIDREKLDAAEADSQYRLLSQQLRNDGTYRFRLGIEMTVLQGATIIDKKAIYLSNANRWKVSVQGKLQRKQLPDLLSNKAQRFIYEVEFPRKSETGEPLIQSLDDNIELSVPTFQGRVKVKYKVRDLVSKLDDL